MRLCRIPKNGLPFWQNESDGHRERKYQNKKLDDEARELLIDLKTTCSFCVGDNNNEI
jgi:hypothetical protein